MKKILCLAFAICALGLCSCGLVLGEFEDPVATKAPMYELMVDGVSQTAGSSFFGCRWEPGMVEIKEVGSKNNSLVIVNNTIEFRCAEDNCKFGDILRVLEVENKPTSREEAEALFAGGAGESLNAFSLRYTLAPEESRTTILVFYFPVEAADEISQWEVDDCCFSAVLTVSNLEAEVDSFENAYDPG